MITLHGNSASPFVRKVLAVLAIKNLPFEQIQQMPFARDKEYQKISPLGKIPALQDGDITVCDSKVICQYLEEQYPDIPVYPSTLKDKTQARWLDEMCSNQVADNASGIFFQRFMRPMAFKQEPDEGLVAKIIDTKLPPLLDYLESQVPSDGFIFNDIGVADISAVSPFINAGYAGYEPDADTWPKLSAFIARVKAHPVMVNLLAAEAAMMGLK